MNIKSIGFGHTIDIIDAAEAVGRYQALPETDLFDMEYWSLEQAKLGKKKDDSFDDVSDANDHISVA